MGRPRKPKNRCLECLYEIDQRSTRCMRCYRMHLQTGPYNTAESARKKRLHAYHTVIVNDPDKLEAHRASAREGMKRLRERRKAESTQEPDATCVPPRVV